MDSTVPDQDAADRQAVIGSVVDQLLASLPATIADAARLGAIPHWFDQQLLGRLHGGPLDLPQIASNFQRFRFGRQDAQGYFRYHDDVRDYLLAWWRRERPQQYEAANRIALADFSTRANEAPLVERPIYEREVLYHLLIVAEATGLQYLSVRFEDACERFQLGLAEGLLTQAAQLSGILTENGQKWVQYFEARLDWAYYRNDAGEATFQTLASTATDSVLQAVARWSLGEIRVNHQRWSQAIGFYYASLRTLLSERAPMYGGRVMLALGAAYCDLADNSGGFREERTTPTGVASQFLHIVQHLPFLIYEWLVRRLYFLPNWYGTNYQDWIIAYLLVEAKRWYRRAERQIKSIRDTRDRSDGGASDIASIVRQLGTTSDTLILSEAQMHLAELEHQMGYWLRARRRYTQLLQRDEIKGSLYRTAQVHLGQGRAVLEEGDLIKAMPLLSEALESFVRFLDDRSVGETAALLGRIYTALDRPGDAISAYIQSAQAFEAVQDQLGRTQIVWALEELARRFTITDEQRQRIDSVVASVAERHYITRFPDALLRRFRGLALLGALPLAYVLTFIISLALMLTLWIIESLFILKLNGAYFTIANTLTLVVFATLPVLLPLWLYRLIYSLTGLALVRGLGRQLIPIERDQPDQIITSVEGLMYHSGNDDSTRMVAWSDVTTVATIDFYQWRRPIHLISRTVLIAGSGVTIVMEAITAGYNDLKRDITRHLNSQGDRTVRRRLDFVIFDGVWMLLTVVVSLACGLFLRIPMTPTTQISTGLKVQLQLTPILLSFVLMLLSLFPTVALWRLVFHRRTVQRVLGQRVPPIIPVWGLWLAATLATLWTVVLVLFVLGSPANN
jgi:tetratricopeptide (TPR) repeat protein